VSPAGHAQPDHSRSSTSTSRALLSLFAVSTASSTLCSGHRLDSERRLTSCTNLSSQSARSSKHTHKLGQHVLHNCLSISILIDAFSISIVAVPGLRCTVVGTWTHPKSKAFWLRDFLPGKLPGARILTFDYDAPAAFGGSYAQFRRSVISLLDSLVVRRTMDEVGDVSELERGILLSRIRTARSSS
jgi:hypothetical protein